MKKLILLISFLVFKLNIIAQSNLKGIVHYGHKQSFGMGEPIGNDYNANLIFDGNSSTYIFAKDSLEGGHLREMNPIRNKKGFFMIMKSTTTEGFIYYTNRSKNLIKNRDIGFYYVKDSIPKINWTILTETKKIGRFDCNKAICSFRGRDYTAWFTLEIPLPYGPWKLQGLPGLILEAYDTNKEILFYFKSIEYPGSENLKIIIPSPKTNTDMERNNPTTKREWISFEDFKKSILKRHEMGTKMGRMISEETPNILSVENANPMRSHYIEIFDED